MTPVKLYNTVMRELRPVLCLTCICDNAIMDGDSVCVCVFCLFIHQGEDNCRYPFFLSATAKEQGGGWGVTSHLFTCMASTFTSCWCDGFTAHHDHLQTQLSPLTGWFICFLLLCRRKWPWTPRSVHVCAGFALICKPHVVTVKLLECEKNCESLIQIARPVRATCVFVFLSPSMIKFEKCSHKSKALQLEGSTV